MEEEKVIEAEVVENVESMDSPTSAGQEGKKKSYKVPALIIGVVMIIAGIIGIALTIPSFFS